MASQVGLESREGLEQSLERHKHALRMAVEDLGVAARSSSDPRGFIREHPVAWLLGAFVLGLCFGRDGRVMARD